MRKHKQYKRAIEALIDNLKARGFGVANNGKHIDSESREYRKEVEQLLGTLGSEGRKRLFSDPPPELDELDKLVAGRRDDVS